MSTDAEQVKAELTPQDIRLHAINLAVAVRRDNWRMSLAALKDGAVEPDLADVCLTDAAKFEHYITDGHP